MTLQKLGLWLDRLNELYDTARIVVCRHTETVCTWLHHKTYDLYRKRLHLSLAAEIERKKPEFEAHLPPDSSLSYFDEYQIINGCPVFTLDAIGTRTHSGPSHLNSLGSRTWSADVQEPPVTSRTRSKPRRLMSFKIDRLKITCYAFSHDDRYIACGMTSGALTVWDAARGTLVRTLSGPHEFRIADVAFMESNSTTLVSVDLDGHCVKWDLTTHPVKYTQTHCAPSWEDSSYVGKELAVPRLSSDGRYMGFPVFTYAEPGISSDDPIRRFSSVESVHAPQLYSILFVYETDALTNMLTNRVDPMLLLPVKVEEQWVGAERLVDLILFSRTSSCLLLTIYELAKGYIVLWPYLHQGNVASYRLHGTRGRFSQGDRFLVTWHAIMSSDEQYLDSNCYVWDLENLGNSVISEDRPGWDHPRYEGANPIVLSDPNRGSVHSCDFVRLKDHVGLVSCCVTEEVTVIIWCLRSRTPLHVLKTEISRDEVHPGAVRMMSAGIRQIDHVHGTDCISVSRNGQWVGIYSSSGRRGYIWNASEGVEVLRIEIPEQMAEAFSGMDLVFSRRATKLLFVGKGLMLLWSPSVLRGFNPADRPLHILDASDPDIDIGQSICKFSGDGNTVGVMRFSAEVMTIWRLFPPQQFTLDRSKQVSDHPNASAGRREQEQSYFQVESAKHRFSQFAVSRDGMKVVTVMGDMSVLLWDMSDVSMCEQIATATSYYCPALDVCFSVDTNRRPMVVIGQDQGILVWIDLLSGLVTDSKATGCARSCQFSADGRTAVLMLNLHQVKVWNLVTRTEMRTLNYSIPILHAPDKGFYPQLAPSGQFCLVGFDRAGAPITARESTSMSELGDSIWYPETFLISADGEWVLMSGQVDQERDSLLLERGHLPDCAGLKEGDLLYPGEFPVIDFREDHAPVRAVPSGVQTDQFKKQTWKIMHIKGEFYYKEMRLPYSLRASRFVALTADGSKCAALNARNQLVVWGTHFTYKSILQQRSDLTEGASEPTRDQIFSKLYEYGPALVNHPYERGMTLVMECVAMKKTQMLQHLISWALESGVKLSFQGRIAPVIQNVEAEDTTPNVIDLAVDIRSPEIIEILLQALMDGATSDAAFAQIMERSLIRLSYRYPTLVLHLFKSRKFMKSLGAVNISEGYLRKRNDYLGVVTDNRLVASETYIQEMWSKNEKATMENLPDRFHVFSVPAEAKVVPYPNVAKMGREGLLQPLLFERAQHFVFGSDVVKGVINFKFHTYARRLLLEDLAHYLVLLFVFTCSSIYAGEQRHFGVKTGSQFTMALVAFVGLGNFIRLLKQFHALWTEREYAGITYYLGDYMKWIELSSYLLVVFFLPITAFARGGDSEVLMGFMATASVLLWVKMLYYAQAFKSTGPMVVMIREIVKDIRWFLFVLVAFLVGFGVAFFVLLGNMNEDDDSETPPEEGSDAALVGELRDGLEGKGSLYFINPFASLLTVFLLMLSDISDILAEVHEAENLETGTRILAFVGIFVFLSAVAIVLLNLLIAIMGDSFDRVKNHEKTLFLQRRAEVIQDMEMGLSKQRKKEINDKIERFLHILVPNFQSTLEESDWEGRLVDIQRRMREELRDARDRGTHDLIQLKRDVKEIKRALTAARASSFPASGGPSGEVERIDS